MLDHIEMNFNNIKRVSNERIFTNHLFTLEVFNTLLTSTNTNFIRYVKSNKYLFKEGYVVQISDIITAVKIITPT